jgi:N utilization substance protein B
VSAPEQSQTFEGLGMNSRTTRGSTQTKARKRALDILFEAELRDADPLATLAERAADAEPPVRDFTRDLVRGVTAHRGVIDARIVAALADGWSLQRLPRVDRNVMRIAVYEIDHTAVPDAVAVSEAVGLAARLSTDDSPTFVNGVLGTVVETKPIQTDLGPKEDQTTSAEAEIA